MVVPDSECTVCWVVPTESSHLLATDALSDTPFPPAPALPPSVALAIAAVAFVLIVESSESREKPNFPESESRSPGTGRLD